MYYRVHYRVYYCLLLGYRIPRNVAATPSTRVTLTSLVTCPLHPTLAASLYTLNNIQLLQFLCDISYSGYSGIFLDFLLTGVENLFSSKFNSLLAKLRVMILPVE